MKKLRLGLVLLALTVSACDNRLPPTKALGADQGANVTSNPVVATEVVANRTSLPAVAFQSEPQGPAVPQGIDAMHS